MEKYKVYVTEMGLVPVDKSGIVKNTGPIKDLFYNPQEKDTVDKTCTAWVVTYYEEDDFSFVASETKAHALPPHFMQELFEHTNSTDFLPIIHISQYNLIEKDTQLKEGQIVRYSQIVDSSIWNYFVKIEIDYERHKVTAPMLNEVILSIRNNHKEGRYELSVSREYANLNYRLVKESWLDGAHGDYVSPFIFHSEKELEKLIESEFNVKNRMSKKSAISKIREHKWRILLVDDKAVKGMSPVNKGMTFDEEEGLLKNSKMAVVRSLLKEHIIDEKHQFCHEKNEVKDDDITTFYVEYAENVVEAQKKLREKKYDLILLDYLLEADVNNKKYGYELLEGICKEVALKRLLDEVNTILLSSSDIGESEFCEIYDAIYQNRDAFKIIKDKEAPYDRLFSDVLGESCITELVKIYKKLESETAPTNLLIDFKSKDCLRMFLDKKIMTSIIRTIRERLDDVGYKIGPRKRFFFIFISAYSSAVYERLLAEGLNQSEDYWHIAVGGCPTNTPQLLLYNLIKLMEKRLDDSGILKLSTSAICELINKIFLPKKQDIKGDSVRKRANALYQKVLSLQYHYRSILKDVEIPFGPNTSVYDTKGSVLMTNFIQKKINLGGMLEHLTQLVHLTAVGTVRQWPEMWEEYIYFKAQFEKQVDEDKEPVDYKALFTNIERYILDLKSQQR